MKKLTAELEQWAEVKREHALTDAQVQMARELGMKPKRLLQPENPWERPLGRNIEALYLRRFRKPQPDSVTPLRQQLHEARAQARAEAHDRRRERRRAELDHAEAARISLLTLRRLLPGGPAFSEDIVANEPPARSH